MFTKTILSTVAAAILATSAVSASTTTASAGKYDSAIAGAVFGAAAVIIGAELANGRQSYRSNGYDGHDNAHYGKRRHVRECFDKPIRRWNAYEGRKVIVGYKTVCN